MNPADIAAPVALVVHGHHAVRRALCERIRASFVNFRVLEAASIDDALYILEQEVVDVVLIEGEGGGVSGLKGTRAILDRAPTASVVVMSAFTEPSCRTAARRAGAIAFVSKRAVGSDLMKVLEDVMERRPTQAETG